MQESPVDINPMSEEVFSSESMDRKARSILRLKIETVPFIEELPVIENSSNATRRTKAEICSRAAALCIVALKGEDLEQDIVSSLVTNYDIESALSPNELSFINNPEPPQRDKSKFAWRYECYWVMLWTLGYAEEINHPDAICNVKTAVSVLADRNMENFIRDARLRSLNKILDHADLTYRYHWAVIDARVNGKDAPAGLNGGVVVQRHYAFKWLTGDTNQGWDNISTDT